MSRLWISIGDACPSCALLGLSRTICTIDYASNTVRCRGMISEVTHAHEDVFAALAKAPAAAPAPAATVRVNVCPAAERRCPTCKSKMLALFTSYVCDYCEGKVAIDWHTAYVVWFADHNAYRWLHTVFLYGTDAQGYLNEHKRFGGTGGTVRRIRFAPGWECKWVENPRGYVVASGHFQIHPDAKYDTTQPFHGHLEGETP